MVVIKNEQNISVPEYLKEHFFTETLEEGLRESKVTLKEINFAWGSNPGTTIARLSIVSESRSLDGPTVGNPR